MEKIKLQRATLKDFNEVFLLEKSFRSKTYMSATTKKENLEYFKDSQIFLIKKDSITIGLTSFKKKLKDRAHVNGLIIKPRFRGQGFARQTMLLLLKKMSGSGYVYLEVHPHNSPAITLYLSLGFVIDSWVENRFGDGEPRLIMVKK
ncbi:MAG: GNAT family N-acetyltransferase [Patescibacteria group bacterium]